MKRAVFLTLGLTILTIAPIAHGDQGLRIPAVLLQRLDDPDVVSLPLGSGAASTPAPVPLPPVRNLLLNAFGTRKLAQGEVRIPVPVGPESYEVIISSPREAALLPLTQVPSEP